ncbi:uncharacterized protein THITE_2107846 [Thermothielavioides terrestris NRRL 8126]|uniref:Zn(2)-C6 fungal-type domain-containing protein n=1 Tax=Thermothielavioides terrestris (strain ATCC 38088 / NRRL 8126) TaxID=578455 RepID=G2QVM1_THETT|nr:uncharacterized protein THITE_2107846 [Thermothielavioides terrestris NRRL 8126]AEO63002.1 hypothetical protein THITE_2107846 [Thermothielavioides terrestris NRRL 8126]
MEDAFNFAGALSGSMPQPPTYTTAVPSSSTPGSSKPSASAPALPVAVATNKPPRILACVLCQHRKIKCDRHFPCANCTKANVQCTPSTPAPARKRRRPNQDLQERLARCEELLKEYAAEKPDQLAARPAQPPNFHDEAYIRWQPEGRLVREDGSVRFMDSPLLSIVYDELRAMREIVDSEDSDDFGSEAITPDENSDLILGGDSPGAKVEDLWPEAAHMLRLWQIFLDRVNPLTKAIHVPTLQPYVAEAANGPQNVPKNIEALMFSIFLMAAVSLTPEECRGLLGYSREEAVQRYSSGVRLSLQRIGFLRSHDLPTLQALVLYLISLQGRYNPHATWILNGVAVRIAQKMGLHRDGEALGLPPFESEMRRRVWWLIFMLDFKYAVFSGLTHSWLPRYCDAKLPKNLNDADMFQSATEPFQDREGPTEMIFCLLTYTFARFVVEHPGLENVVMIAEGVSNSKRPTEEELAEYMRGFGQLREKLLEVLDKYCDPTAGPVHEMAIAMKSHLTDKLNDLMTPLKERPDGEGEVRSAQDNAFKVAIMTLEHDETNYVLSKDKGFAWFSLQHFRLELFMYVAGQLCSRTEGKLVERAWKQVIVVYSYHPELFDVTNKNYAALAVFILKAWRKREQVILARTGTMPEVPSCIEKLRACMPNEDIKTEPTPPEPPYTPANLNMDLTPGPNAAGMPQDPLGQFWNFFDSQALDWDMFGSPAVNVDGPAATMNGFGGFGAAGPSVEW